MTFAVIKAREELRVAALRVLSAEHLDHSGAHDAAEQEYADDQLAVAALHLTAAVATSDDPMDRPAAGWEPEALSDGFHTFAELYEHRHALFCALVRLAPELTVWRTRLHEDGSMHEGMFLAGIALPNGDVSYHLPDHCWDLLPGVRVLARAPHFNGYTPADVVDRLNSWRPWDPEQEGEDLVAKTMLEGMGPDPGGGWSIRARPPHDLVWAMAAALAESIGDAPNYQETGITFEPTVAGQRKEFTLTVQRVSGKTPAQLRQDAEERLAKVTALAWEALDLALDHGAGDCSDEGSRCPKQATELENRLRALAPRTEVTG